MLDAHRRRSRLRVREGEANGGHREARAQGARETAQPTALLCKRRRP